MELSSNPINSIYQVCKSPITKSILPCLVAPSLSKIDFKNIPSHTSEKSKRNNRAKWGKYNYCFFS